LALIFITGNPHKFEEARGIAEKHGVRIIRRTVPYVEIQAEKLEDIVRPGVQQAWALIRKPCFIEDAGLFIDALNGFPGPYSKFVFLTIGNEGLLKLMEGKTDRRAVFKSAVGYCASEGKPRVFTGMAAGKISLAPRGSHGFGYDPIFIAEKGDGRTFAEMPTEDKNKFSHRADALEKFFKWYRETHESQKHV
jgi:XTP/dITP diphosphohydrolase